MNMVTILIMSAKMATPDLLKIKVFWNKVYDVIISDYDVTFITDSNHIVDVSLVTVGFLWEKLS